MFPGRKIKIANKKICVGSWARGGCSDVLRMESVLLQGEEISDGVLIHTQRGGTVQAGSSKHPSLCECGTAVLTGACSGCTKQKIHVQGTHGTKWPLQCWDSSWLCFGESKQGLKTEKSLDMQMCALFGAGWCHWQQRGEGSKEPDKRASLSHCSWKSSSVPQ